MTYQLPSSGTLLPTVSVIATTRFRFLLTTQVKSVDLRRSRVLQNHRKVFYSTRRGLTHRHNETRPPVTSPRIGYCSETSEKDGVPEKSCFFRFGQNLCDSFSRLSFGLSSFVGPTRERLEVGSPEMRVVFLSLANKCP